MDAMSQAAPTDPNAAPMDEAPEGDMSQGYCIEISVLSDGTFNVRVEPLKDESAETGTPEPAGKSVKDIGEALKAALMIYQNQGKDVDQEAEFNAGMSGSGAPTPKDMAY